MPLCPYFDKVTVESVTAAYARMNYPFFTKGNYNINLFGIRNDDAEANTFNDLVGMLFKINDVWTLKKYNATTDPGLYYRLNPMNVAGTAILCSGYIPKAFKIGLHKGIPALVQNVPFKVWRDNNKDKVLDWNENSDTASGMYAINMHRATSNKGGKSTLVDKWSAGCQVIAANNDMDEIMSIANTAAKTYGPVFSYALFTEKDFFG